MSTNRMVPIISSIEDMHDFTALKKGDGKTLALVPTMGALHEGHLSLLNIAAENADVVVVSIFVNPTQFGEGEDYSKYKRDIEGDIEKISSYDVDVVFTPTAKQIFPEGFQTYVEVTGLQDNLCGRFRSGHFRGVATVVLKLFNIVSPDIAVFGEKDYQQLKIIQKMVKDLNLDISIFSSPIVREESGLALSSRNDYLSEEERRTASGIFRALTKIRQSYEGGENDVKTLIDIGVKILLSNNINQIDYLEIRDGETLGEVDRADAGNIVAVAARIGSARLIDNIKL